MSSLSVRSGTRPRATKTNPHTQLDQLAPIPMQEALARRLFALDGVVEQPSRISVPGARALVLRADVPAGPSGAFLIGREFAHVHPPYDGSLHAALPPALAEEAIRTGWAELHPIAMRGLIPPTIVMLYGPRDEAELEVVVRLVEASLAWARGG